MYALILVLLIIFFYWYSNRAPPPVYEAPIIPDLTNTINTGPTDMSLVLPVASVDNNVYASSSVDNSIVPITPPLGTSVAVPDMTSTDVMNTPTEVVAPAEGGAVDPAASPTVAELAGEIVEEAEAPQPTPSSACICNKWSTNKNKCMRKVNKSGHLVHITKGGGICPDPVCQSQTIMGIHNYVKYFPKTPIPSIVMNSPNNIYGLCQCAKLNSLCVKNKKRCMLGNTGKPCLWPQCKNQVSSNQIKKETIAMQKQAVYAQLLSISKQKDIIRDGAQKSLDSYTTSFNSFKETLSKAKLEYDNANTASSQALVNKNNAVSSGASMVIQAPIIATYNNLQNITNTKFKTYSAIKLQMSAMEKTFITRQTAAIKAKNDANAAANIAKKAEKDATDAYAAAYGKQDTSSSIASSVGSAVASAFGNLSGFLNYRSGYRRY